jgi:hypothetical protein
MENSTKSDHSQGKKESSPLSQGVWDSSFHEGSKERKVDLRGGEMSEWEDISRHIGKQKEDRDAWQDSDESAHEKIGREDSSGVKMERQSLRRDLSEILEEPILSVGLTSSPPFVSSEIPTDSSDRTDSTSLNTIIPPKGMTYGSSERSNVKEEETGLHFGPSMYSSYSAAPYATSPSFPASFSPYPQAVASHSNAFSNFSDPSAPSLPFWPPANFNPHTPDMSTYPMPLWQNVQPQYLPWPPAAAPMMYSPLPPYSYSRSHSHSVPSHYVQQNSNEHSSSGDDPSRH